MSKGFTSTYRIALLAVLVLVAFAGLSVRLVWLHVIDRDELLRSVDEARRQLIINNARRGDIVDFHDALLATSRSVVVLGVDPQFLRPEDRSKWPQLAALIGMPLERLRTIFETKFRPVSAVLAKGEADTSLASEAVIRLPLPGSVQPQLAAPAPAVSADQNGDDTELDDPDRDGNRPIRWAKLSDQVPESVYADILKLDIRGVYGSRVYRRDYPHNDLAAQVIGYVDRQERPVSGIEEFADFYLKGENGWLESEKDGRSHEMAQFRTREVPPSDGFTVGLSIDATIQRMAEDELAAINKKFSPQKATIIVSDPRTGFVLALANSPSFDLNAYNQVPKDQQASMRNIAVTDQYEPGSVFKIVAVSGALNEGLVTPQTRFDCTLEKIDYNGSTRNLPREDASDHFDRPLSVAEIIEKSSNKGAAQLAMALGDQRFYKYVRAFGFGQKTGFPVGGEIAGSVRPPEKWDSLTITRMPMGQSIAATVLQMQQAMGVIASGGLLLRPQVIRKISDADGNLVYRFGRVEERRVISEQTAATVARLLTAVASAEGTAPEAAIPGFEVAGKTATAQKVLPVTLASGATVMRYSLQHHVASFVGFFPASNPQVAIAVVVDDADEHCPGGIAYGHIVAAPAFKHLGERLIPYLPIRAPGSDQANAMLAMGGGR